MKPAARQAAPLSPRASSPPAPQQACFFRQVHLCQTLAERTTHQPCFTSQPQSSSKLCKT
eukprot:1158322-Pelagomonas_calceolata.AAC.2